MLTIFLVFSFIVQVDTTVDLSTPEKAIDTYYRGYITNNLWLTDRATGGIGGSYQRDEPLFRDYKILSLDTSQTEQPFILVGDVIAVVEVYSTNDSLPPLKISHILRKIDGQWYSVSHAYIPDKNYPDLDPDIGPEENPW